jgi:hypothetical protein
MRSSGRLGLDRERTVGFASKECPDGGDSSAARTTTSARDDVYVRRTGVKDQPGD